MTNWIVTKQRLEATEKSRKKIWLSFYLHGCILKSYILNACFFFPPIRTPKKSWTLFWGPFTLPIKIIKKTAFPDTEGFEAEEAEGDLGDKQLTSMDFSLLEAVKWWSSLGHVRMMSQALLNYQETDWIERLTGLYQPTQRSLYHCELIYVEVFPFLCFKKTSSALWLHPLGSLKPYDHSAHVYCLCLLPPLCALSSKRTNQLRPILGRQIKGKLWTQSAAVFGLRLRSKAGSAELIVCAAFHLPPVLCYRWTLLRDDTGLCGDLAGCGEGGCWWEEHTCDQTNAVTQAQIDVWHLGWIECHLLIVVG